MLTNAAAKAATARDRAYKLSDAGGLHLHVATTGAKRWRLKYRIRGREKLLTIGAFPAMSIADARARREVAKQQLRQGEDPAGGDIEVNTFEQLARAWYQHNLASWSTSHAADVLGSLDRDVFPQMGDVGINLVAAPGLLNVLRSVEQRGCIETARRLRQRLSEIFAFGIAMGLVENDPAAKLGAAMLEVPPARPQPALTTIESCRELLAACDRAAARPITRLASRFLALTAVRLEAVRGMRWSEVTAEEDRDDLQGRWLWIVPPARMKLKKAKKGEERFAHFVPLSAQAVAVLRRAAAENGHDTRSGGDELVFPGRDRGRPIGEGAIGDLYDRAGFSGRHVPHGWRSSFSTILNEDLGEEWSISIDRALAHSPKDKVEAAYNRAQLLDRRRALFDRWGTLLAG